MLSLTAALTGGSPLGLLNTALDAGAGLIGQGGVVGKAAGAWAGATGPAASVSARAVAGEAATAKTTARKASTTSKASTAKKASTTKKASTAKKASTTKATGYATRLPADYAFLRDPRLSIEEKLSRFIGMLMTRSEQDLLRQMEKMAPGAAAAGGTGSTGGTGGTGGTTQPKKSGFSLWGIAKSVIPALNLASQVVGDAQLKKLVTQVSGPVLAAACTAIGLPQLAPLAQKYGPQLVGMLSKDITVDLGLLTGGGASGSTSATSGSSGSAGASTKAASADPGTSEKAQLLELQRLQDRDKELFSLFSNMMKAMHDARMTSIQNIR